MRFLKILVLLLPSANICAQHFPPRAAREEVDLGLKAHRNSHFAEATQHFRRALAIDTDFCWARLYLASSFGAEYVPHVDSADNLAMAKEAFEHYQTAMKCDPALSAASLIGMAHLKVLMERPAEAREFYRQLLKIPGDDPDKYSTIAIPAIAMCDLEEAEANTRAEKARLGLKPDESLADDPACPALRKRNLPLVEEGLQMLNKAMWLHPSDNGGDQVTLSVFYSERSEIECGDPTARKADEKNAAEWNDLAAKIANKKRGADKQ